MKQNDMKVAVYIRVARADQWVENEQRKRLGRFVLKQGLSNSVCYVDNGFHGLSLDHPNFFKAEVIQADNIRSTLAEYMCRHGIRKNPLD